MTRHARSSRQWVDADDIRQAVNHFQRRGEHVLQAAKNALREGARDIVTDAKSRVPVKTGKLRDSIHAIEKENGAVQEITADAKNESGVPYGKIVEYSPRINRPFLKPAIESNRDNINRKIADALRQS